MLNDIENLFIVGVGRSGTSLLQSMLGAHKEIVMMPETSFIRRYLIRPIGRPKKIVGINILSSDSYLERWVNDGAIPPLIKDFEFNGLNNLYQQATDQYVHKSKNIVKYVADKDPKLIEVLPHLNNLFTNYKVIHIIRDPRDVLLSKNKAAWSKDQPFIKKIIANNVQLKIYKSYIKKNSHKAFEIKYEDLLENTESTLNSICSFLGLPYDEQMLNFQNQAEQLVSKDEMSWKKETFGPLLTANFNKWKSEMSASDAFLVETCCKGAMIKGGHEYSTAKIGLVGRVQTLLYKVFFSIS